jgi:hypothetical protein
VLAPSGRQLAALTAAAARYSPDGRSLALAEPATPASKRGLGRWQSVVSLRASATGSVRWRRTTYGRVEHLAFSPDGRWLALGSSEGLELCDVATGTPVVQHRQLGAGAIAFGAASLTVGGLPLWSFAPFAGTPDELDEILRCLPVALVDGRLRRTSGCAAAAVGPD